MTYTNNLIDFSLLPQQVLDANDNAPQCLKSVYLGSIFENAASGTSVTGVSAVDKDTAAVQNPIKYLLGKDAGNMFKIDSTTGVITTGKNSI